MKVVLIFLLSTFLSCALCQQFSIDLYYPVCNVYNNWDWNLLGVMNDCIIGYEGDSNIALKVTSTDGTNATVCFWDTNSCSLTEADFCTSLTLGVGCQTFGKYFVNISSSTAPSSPEFLLVAYNLNNCDYPGDIVAQYPLWNNTCTNGIGLTVINSTYVYLCDDNTADLDPCSPYPSQCITAEIGVCTSNPYITALKVILADDQSTTSTSTSTASGTSSATSGSANGNGATNSNSGSTTRSGSTSSASRTSELLSLSVVIAVVILLVH